MRAFFLDALEIVGFALTTYGAYELRPFLGYIVGGLFLALIANSFDKGSE